MVMAANAIKIVVTDNALMIVMVIYGQMNYNFINLKDDDDSCQHDICVQLVFGVWWNSPGNNWTQDKEEGEA